MPTPIATPAAPRSRARWFAAVLVALALLVAAVLVLALRPGTTDPHPLAVAGSQAFDPLGHPPGEENNGDAHLATDGDPATAWSTEHYRNPDAMGKPGVGLVVRLEAGARLTDLAVTSASTGWTAAVYVVDGTSPADLGGWGAPVASRAAIPAGTATFALAGRRGTAVLLWITRTGDDGRVDVTDVIVTGR